MKYTLLILLLSLPLMVFAASLSVGISFPSPTGDPAFQDYAKLGLGTSSSPGTPQLPVKSINIILPPGAFVTDWQVKFGATTTLNGSAPQLNRAFSDGERLLSAASSRDNISPYSFLGMRKWGDVQYAAFSVLPARWNGSEWSWNTSCRIGLDYAITKQTSNVIPPILTDASFFANPENLELWYQPTNTRNYDVLVIGTPALYASLSNWVTFRESQGLVVSFTDIATALSQGSGTTDEARLRSYLISQYEANAFSYMLLVGDYDTVPVAYLTPEPDGLDTVPSDFFYGDLSSNWDTDNDGRLGEYSTGFMNQDYGVDFTPEVYVGRISTNSASNVTAIANRFVAYEQSSGLWKNKNLLPAAWLNYLGEPETNMPATDGALTMEIMKNTALASQLNTTLYEQLGVVPSFSSDYPLDYDMFKSLLDNQSWGFVNWSAHGSSASSSRKVWMQDNNSNNFPDSDEMEWLNLINRQSFDNLANTDGTVIFAASCYNGQIDGSNTSLAEYALIKKAVGVIGATRTGWYKVGWLNPGWGGLSSYNYHFVENYRQNGLSGGAAHAVTNLLHSQYYLFGDPIDTGGIIWPELQNIYTYLYFGDPLIGYMPDLPLPQGEILVWEPTQTQGWQLVNALRAATDMNVIYSDKLIEDYAYLNNFEAVFCLFGYGDTSYILNPASFEYNLLNGYLAGGGKLYLEGSVSWNPLDDFWGKFGAHAPLDMLAYIESVQHISSSNIWQYADVNRFTDALLPYSATAVPVFKTHNTSYSDSNIGIWNSNGNYRTLASSFRLTDVLNGEHDLNEIVSIICDTLGVINNAPVGNSDAALVPLVQNLSAYPNPSFGVSNIRFTLNKAASVQLDVYNLKGQRVSSLSQGKLAAGDHALLWNGLDTSGKQCASGIYFFRLDAGGRIASVKQILLH
ncbi:MAG: C25 family cysteine peptidase [Candidatus Cloacimonas sp.]|jgi:hypothetical protein|nr:C25 family cysteine peptidase [Candidatus Cloacimonas sp.]